MKRQLVILLETTDIQSRSCLLTVHRYDQHLSVGEEREEIRTRFSGVISFVENYLQNISSNIWSFSDKEQNKLTFEVTHDTLVPVVYFEGSTF